MVSPVSSVPRRRTTNLVVTPLAPDLLVYDETTNALHTLNPIAAAVWQGCDHDPSVESLISATGHTREAVLLALGQLSDAELLTAPLHPSLRPTSNRRDLLRKATIIGLPVIVSISAPSATAASSTVCVDTCSFQNTTAPCCNPAHECSDAPGPPIEYTCRPRRGGGGGIR